MYNRSDIWDCRIVELEQAQQKHISSKYLLLTYKQLQRRQSSFLSFCLKKYKHMYLKVYVRFYENKMKCR